MAQMVAAYSMQKMRKVLNELLKTILAQKEAQRMQKENNQTSNFRENSNANSNSGNGGKTDDKRSGINNNVDDGECKYARKD